MIKKRCARTWPILSRLSPRKLELTQFKEAFQRQFEREPVLGERAFNILDGYFREDVSAGLLVYEEFLVADKPVDRVARQQAAEEVKRAYKLMTSFRR